MTVCRKILRPFTDSRDLLIDLKRNSLLISFLMLLVSLFFYELYRMGSSSIIYLYLHRYGFDDVLYAAYFSIEQLANCLALLCLALLRNRWKINDLYLCIFGLCLSLIGPMLFAFAQENKRMIFGGKISSVFISTIDAFFFFQRFRRRCSPFILPFVYERSSHISFPIVTKVFFFPKIFFCFVSIRRRFLFRQSFCFCCVYSKFRRCHWNDRLYRNLSSIDQYIFRFSFHFCCCNSRRCIDFDHVNRKKLLFFRRNFVDFLLVSRRFVSIELLIWF